jgi:hypothetical protein
MATYQCSRTGNRTSSWEIGERDEKVTCYQKPVFSVQMKIVLSPNCTSTLARVLDSLLPSSHSSKNHALLGKPQQSLNYSQIQNTQQNNSLLTQHTSSNHYIINPNGTSIQDARRIHCSHCCDLHHCGCRRGCDRHNILECTTRHCAKKIDRRCRARN